MLVHYDHGDTTELLGDNGDPVIDLENIELLSGREAYNMNCLSAQVLGLRAHDDYGCVAYWGYTEVVSFTTDALTEFKQALNYGFFQRLQGDSWEDCVSKTKEVMQQLANELASSGKIIAAVAMTNNMDALVCYNGGSTPTESTCPFRLLAHKFLPKKFKKYAWKVSSRTVYALLLQSLGTGLTVHDFILECQKIADPYRFPPHGFWWGTLLIVIGLALMSGEIIQTVQKPKRNMCS